MEQSPALAMSRSIVCHHIKSAATHTSVRLWRDRPVISGAKLSRGAPGAYDHIFELGRLHAHQMEQSPALAMSRRIVCHHIKSAATHTPCFGAFMA